MSAPTPRPRIAQLSRRTLLGGGLAALGSGLAACATRSPGSDPTLPNGPDIVVGACLELTGASAVAGVSAERGIRVALDEINAVGLRVGGKLRKIQLVVLDNRSDPDTAASLTTQLITSSQVSAVIGGAVATTSVAMSPIAEQHQVTMVSLAAADSIVKPVPQHRFVFKLGPDAYRVADLMVAHMAANGIKTVGVLAEGSAHGDAGLAALTDSGRAQGVTVKFHARLPVNSTDFHTQAAQLVNAGVPAVVIWAEAPLALMAATAVRKATFLGVRYFDTGAAASDAIDLANNAVMGGSLFVAPLIMTPDAELGNNSMSYARQVFFNDYTRRYGAMSAQAIFGADALRMIGTAAERAVDPTRLRVRNGLESAPLYQLAGSYMFSTINHGGVLPDQLALLRLTSTGWQRV